MNGLDIALLAIIGLSTAVGAFRGFVREVMGLLGIVIAAVLAYLFAPQVAEVIGGEGPLMFVVAAVLIFVTALVGSGLLARGLSALLDAIFLGGLNRFLGGVFGFARAVALTVAGIVLLVTLVGPDVHIMRESRVIEWEASAIEWVGERLPYAPAREKFREHWSIMREGSAVRVHLVSVPRTGPIPSPTPSFDIAPGPAS
jgi:membrane protein required for colicin V production